MEELTYAMAPNDWAICFQDDCPLRDTCLRRAMARLAPPTLTHHAVVLPAARSGPRCQLFVEAAPVVLARGMRNMLPRAARGELSQLHEGLYAIFGSTSQYYRYRRGELPITPEQQARVAALLQKHGYKGEPHFDSMTAEYHFPKP